MIDMCHSFSSLVIVLMLMLASCNYMNYNNPKSAMNYVNSFELEGVVQQIERSGHEIFIYVPYDTDLSEIMIKVDLENATINPQSESFIDFTTPKTFTIKAENGRKLDFQVTVKKSQWKQILKNEEAPFLRVDGHQLIVFKDKLWLLGGWLGKYDHDKASFKLGNSHWTSQVWCTSDGENWESKGDAPWAGRHGFGCVVFDDKIWVIGGDQHTDIWNSEDGVHWNKVLDEVPWGERYFPYIVSFKGKIWVMGGIHIDFAAGNELREKYNDVWSSTDGVNWVREVEFVRWMPRGLISGSAILNDELYLYGGSVLYSYAFNDVWKTDNGIDWTKVISHAPWSPRQWNSIANSKDNLWVMAGDYDVRNDTMLNDVWYSPDGEFWTEQKGVFWEPRHAAPVIEYKNKLWLIGGLISRNDGGVANDVWAMDLIE